jgi:3D (Asp-Asp-Asp) domain-containing protein
MDTSILLRRVLVSSCFMCCLALHVHAQQVSDFSLPVPKLEANQKKQLWATWYYLFPAKENTNGIPLMDTKNKPISVPIAEKEWCLGAMSGAINVESSNGQRKTYNYIDSRGPLQVDCRKYVRNGKSWVTAIGRSRFHVSDGPYGDGFYDSMLIPYRTIAVDKRVIPLGTVLFVPSARGSKIKLPSGKMAVHDGYFYVGDKGGGGVKKNHIDVFSGSLAENPFPSFISHTPKKSFEAFVVKDQALINKLAELHERPSVNN